MKELNISHAAFESIYHDSEKCGGNAHSEYIYSNIDVFTTLTINDQEYAVNFQAGHSYYNNDYSLPCKEISMEELAGTDAVIATIEQMYEADFDDVEFVKETLADNNIEFTVEEASQIYKYIRENLDVGADLEYTSLIESSDDEIKSSLQEKEDQKEAMREDWDN